MPRNHTGDGTLERLATLLSAARSADPSAPAGYYAAQARVAFDAARAELESLRINLESLEQALKGESHG